MTDDYCYENGVLKNKLGITDENELSEAESRLTYLKTAELLDNPIRGNFDLDHLKEIHREIFGEIYEWAGEIRTVDISKGDTTFCLSRNIENYAKTTVFPEIGKDLEKLKKAPSIYQGRLPEILAYHLGEINALHPFREGNGRAQKLFIGQMAKSHGLEIHWHKMPMDQFIKGSVESFKTTPRIFTELIRENSRQITSAAGLDKGKGRGQGRGI